MQRTKERTKKSNQKEHSLKTMPKAKHEKLVGCLHTLNSDGCALSASLEPSGLFWQVQLSI